MCNNVNDLLDAIMKRDGELMERSKQKKNITNASRVSAVSLVHWRKYIMTYYIFNKNIFLVLLNDTTVQTSPNMAAVSCLLNQSQPCKL